MLEQALTAHAFESVAIDPAKQDAADKGFGYLYDHPDIAADLGRNNGARWVVVGRVHKASFLFVYFKAHLVDAASGEQVAELVVEVKGPQQRLTQQGVEALADQIVAAVAERESLGN